VGRCDETDGLDAGSVEQKKIKLLLMPICATFLTQKKQLNLV
jgi:hypothetical protein